MLTAGLGTPRHPNLSFTVPGVSLPKSSARPGALAMHSRPRQSCQESSPPDPLIIPLAGGDSLGLFVSALDPGGRFGAHGQKVKKWPAPASLPAEGHNFLKWLAWYQISQSGMLPEAYFDVTEQDFPWRFDHLSGGGGSVRVGEASHLLRMARALELVEADVDKFGPLQEGCLTWWLSGSAVVIGAATFGALLSQGLSWATANCLGLPISTMFEVIAAETPALTGSRVDNRAGLKGQLFGAGGAADFSQLAPLVSNYIDVIWAGVA